MAHVMCKAQSQWTLCYAARACIRQCPAKFFVVKISAISKTGRHMWCATVDRRHRLGKINTSSPTNFPEFGCLFRGKQHDAHFPRSNRHFVVWNRKTDGNVRTRLLIRRSLGLCRFGRISMWNPIQNGNLGFRSWKNQMRSPTTAKQK